MVKPLIFKGDKKPKKRKRGAETDSKVAATTAEAAATDSDASWVNVEKADEIAGPVLVVLPGATVSALSCDAAGKVFAIGVENIVDGNRSSAEPHDVRQVWVVSKVLGTDGFRFKGAHGRFLSASPSGALSADTEAISSLETFTVVPADTKGAYHIRTTSGRYLTSSSIKSESGNTRVVVRCDSDTADGESSLVWLRMQAKYKPKTTETKEEKHKDRVTRREAEKAVGRVLEDDEYRKLKRAKRDGDYYEKVLDIKAKGRHDKYS